jgi:predicted O-methyltransferase YrrM
MDNVTERFRAEVVSHGEFEHDWFTVHVSNWTHLLEPLRGKHARVLELGSYEGMSACFLLWWLSDAHVTCVESFEGYFGEADLEGRFDRNVALVDSTRVRKLTGKTREVLPGLIDQDHCFAFIYVDASHLALDVLADAALAWQLLAPGGLMLFDDYGLDQGDPLLTPRVAVDAFFSVVEDHAERRFVGKQLVLQRRVPIPDQAGVLGRLRRRRALGAAGGSQRTSGD